MFRLDKTFFFLSIFFSLALSTAQTQDVFEQAPVPPGGRIDAIAVTDAGTPLAMGIGDLWRYDNASSQWTKAQRLSGSSSNTKRFSLGPNGSIWAASVGAGLWRSTDDGKTWALFPAVVTYAYDVLELGNGEILAAVHGRGVMYSSDDGATWEERSNGLSSKYSRAIKQDESGALYVGFYSDIMCKSTDKGMNWTELSGSPSKALDLLYASDGTLYASTQSAVHRTTDGGATWETTGPGLANTIARLAEASDGTVYALSYSGSNGLYRYDSAAGSWTALPKSDDAGYGRGIALADDGSIYSAAVNGVWRTSDNGQSWTELNAGIYAMGVHDIVETADGTYIMATDYQGIFRSTDVGGSWTRTRTGLTTIEFYALAADPAGDVYAGGRYGLIFRSTDSGISWTEQNRGSTIESLRRLLYAGDGTLYATGRDGVQASTDKGVTWETRMNGIPAVKVNVISETPTGHLLAGTDGNGAFLSTDAGSSWQALHQDLASKRVMDFALHGSDIFISAASEAVFGSRDNGATWESYSSGNIASWVESLLMTEQGVLFAGHSTAVSVLNPGNDEWAGLTPEFRYVQTVKQLSDKRLYIGSLADGLYRSTAPLSEQLPGAPTLLSPASGAENTGTEPTFTWTEQSGVIFYDIQFARDAAFQDMVWEASLPASAGYTIDPKQLDANAEYHWRLAAGNGAGLGPWSETRNFHTGLAAGIDDVASSAHAFALTSSPNPFASSTLLTATLPKREHVRLRIIDMLGRTVAQLSDTELDAGMHAFTFSAAALPTGYYTALLEAGDRVMAHRILLVR